MLPELRSYVAELCIGFVCSMHILWLVGVLGVGGIIHYRLCYLPMIITEVAIEVVLLPPLAFPVSEVDVECRGSVTFEIRVAQLHYLRYRRCSWYFAGVY